MIFKLLRNRKNFSKIISILILVNKKVFKKIENIFIYPRPRK